MEYLRQNVLSVGRGLGANHHRGLAERLTASIEPNAPHLGIDVVREEVGIVRALQQILMGPSRRFLSLHGLIGHRSQGNGRRLWGWSSVVVDGSTDQSLAVGHPMKRRARMHATEVHVRNLFRRRSRYLNDPQLHRAVRAVRERDALSIRRPLNPARL